MPVEPSTPQKGAVPRSTIIAEKSSHARHSPCQITFPRLELRVGKHMSGNNLDVSAQPAKLRPHRACKFNASIYRSAKTSQSYGNRYFMAQRLRRSREFFYRAAGFRHHAIFSQRNDDCTALRHASFIASASLNLSFAEGENAICSHSESAVA